jgi:ankyrin repeat protein
MNGSTAMVRTLLGAGADPNLALLLGETPLMAASRSGNPDVIAQLIDKGANVNARGPRGQTALMWAVDDLEKTRLLIDRGADVNAQSDAGRTPLLIAAGRFGSGAVLKLLLDRGANPSVNSPGLVGPMTPLTEAAYTGDETVLRMLIDRGADVKGAGFTPLVFALQANCARCVEMLIGGVDKKLLNIAMFLLGPPLGDARMIKALLDRGADASAKDPEGHTLLMLAAASDALPAETVNTLIARGVDVNARSSQGHTALAFAPHVREVVASDCFA